jgi:KDO2-lipid IV(A) lauroyltransferase
MPKSDRRKYPALHSAFDFCVYVMVRLLVATIQVLPTDTAASCCAGGAWLLTRVLGVRQETLQENFQRVYPQATHAQLQHLTQAMWYHLLLMLCEVAWAPRRLHRCNWQSHVFIPNSAHFLEHLLSRRATVLVTGHFGNFELGGYVTGLMGIRTTTIARRLDNAFLHDYVTRFRGGKGQRMVDKAGCAADVDRHLARGGTLSLLADQHGGPKGCWTPFLGHPASYHKALALFSLASDAPMAVAFTIRNGQPMHFRLGCAGVADPRSGGPECSGVRALTQWYSRLLEEVISQAPDQYWWVHRRWREPPQRAARIAA